MSSHFGAGLISTPFDWNKSIWNVKTAPKIRDFLWRTVRKAIPISSNLATRGIQEFPCKRCNGVEDDLHLFLQCDIAREVWELAPLAVKPSSATPSMATLIAAAPSFIVLPPVGLTIPLWPWILWHLWKARNKLSFENRAFSSMEIILKAITDAREWQSAQCTDQIGSIVAARSSTLPPSLHVSNPPHDTVICNVDAAWDSITLKCGIGGIFSAVCETVVRENPVVKATNVKRGGDLMEFEKLFL
ncbi:hypothetical protein IGI04_040262 [Brassica rapa subsp. trilocularis]|uniref:Reverse transcriptase zinc-binding domain-containing protein n=1 Tax=Brassica rapa subsp. trilocularis TaxID=1813537 RepID=A0ABQ7KRI4_BRACM|nr:hypothetical protein IGI04_040262 [Brassica rapa subsp. trilocularis]